MPLTWRQSGALLPLLALALVANAFAAEVRRPEEVKAAFLYNFTRFVEWPSAAFEKPDSPLIIAVAGNETIAVELQRMVRGESVHGHPLQVRYLRRASDFESAHVLYIDPVTGSRFDDLLGAARGRPILVVGERDGFLQDGGMIQFITGRTISLRINLRQAREAGLAISSQLLRIAELENK